MEQFAGAQDFWSLQEEIRLLKVAQFEHQERLSNHAERLGRLEKRHDDTRIRSLWSTPSPFPAPLSTFAQQPATTDHNSNFNGYDGQSNMVLSQLQLDEVDVPRRGASRANSVRFDDSATTNHWINDSNSPSNSDYFGHRSSQSVGGYAMTERSSSHKSDQRSEGRQSSMRSYGGEVGSSAFEVENGNYRPSTQGTDILDSCLHRRTASVVTPALAIIRCSFNSQPLDPIYYAVVCTGSAKSSIEISLIRRLGLEDRIEHHGDDDFRIQMTLYLPDASVQQHARATTSPGRARLTAQLSVLRGSSTIPSEGDIGIFLGCDIMSSHMGDVLFSQSQLLLHIDDGRKVKIPFVRPNPEKAFSDIHTIRAESLRSGLKDSHPRRDVNPITTTHPVSSVPALSLDDAASLHPQLSSPRPILGRQASVIRGVASMGSPDFPPKDSSHNFPTEPDHGVSVYQEADRNRPWTTPAGRTTSFGSDVSTNPRLMSDGEDSRAIGNSKSENGETVTRGRSLTNPYALSAGSTTKIPGGSVWDGGRKASLTSSGTSGGKISQTRGASRSMKVLRTSKSFSSSEKAQSGGGEQSKLTNSKPLAIGGGRSNHSRAVSGDASSMKNGGSGLVRTKSSNVVGGATAFHWMAPKTAATEDQ